MNHPLRIMASLFGLLLAMNGLFAQGQSLSMEQAVSYALSNSLEMKDAQLKITDADAQIKENIAIGLPQLKGSVNYQRYLEVPQQPLPEAFQVPGGPESISFFLKNNLTAAVNLDAMVFDGSYFVALRAARAARSYVQVELTTRQKTLAAQVRDAYMPVLLLEANKAQIEKNVNSLQKLHDETKAIFEEGFAEQLDVDRLALSLANLKTEQENLNRQYDMALRALKLVINLPENETLELADELDVIAQLVDPATVSTATNVNFDQFPELRLIDEGLGLQDLNLKIQKSGYLPKLRAFGGYQYQYQGDKFSDGFWAPTGFVGLNLAVPIYDGGYKRSQVQRVHIATDRALIQRESALQMFTLQLQNAQDAYDNAKDRLNDRDENLALAQRIYDTTQIKYREGVGSSLEVNQAEQSLYSAQSNRLQALYELLKARIELSEALGTL